MYKRLWHGAQSMLVCPVIGNAEIKNIPTFMFTKLDLKTEGFIYAVEVHYL